jgi:hypothetical protein
MAAHRGPKRPPPPKVNLPDISEYAVEKLANVLRERSQAQRLPDQTARVLVLLVAMWQSSPPIPFPDRKQVAAHLGVSVPCVDVTLSYRQGTGDISVAYTTAQGNVGGRLHSTIRQRFVIPSDEIRRIVNDAVASERPLATTVEAVEFTVIAPSAINSAMGCEVCDAGAAGDAAPAAPLAPIKNKRSRKKVAA